MNAATTFTAVKATYDRKTKSYKAEHVAVEPGGVIAALNSGFYVTDSIERFGSEVAAGRCAWYAGLPAAKQQAVAAWLAEYAARADRFVAMCDAIFG